MLCISYLIYRLDVEKKESKLRKGKSKIDSNFLQVYKGVAIKEGLNFSAILGALLYKYNYWNYKAPDYLYQQYISNDDYFYITQFDMTEECLLSPKVYNPELDKMKELGLIDMIKERGKPVKIKVNFQSIQSFVKEADNFYISSQRENKEVRKKYKEYKHTIKNPSLPKVKLLVEKFNDDMTQAQIDDLLTDISNS